MHKLTREDICSVLVERTAAKSLALDKMESPPACISLGYLNSLMQIQQIHLHNIYL